MLNEKKIITMSRMAMYDNGHKKKCLKIGSYYKKDYISLQVIITFIWTTLLYLVGVAAWGLWKMEEILSEFSIEYLIDLGIWIGGLYLVALIIVGIISGFIYRDKYNKALFIAKGYYRALGDLHHIYRRGK